MWGVAEDQVFAAGDGGSMIRFDGSRWSAMDSGTGEALTGLWAASSEDLWAAGGAGVRRFDGTRWTTVPGVDPEPDARAWIAGTGPSDVWLSGGRDGAVRRYDGARWSTIYAGDPGGPHPLWVDRTAATIATTDEAKQLTVRSWYGAGAGPPLARGGLWTDAWAARSGEWIAIGTDEAGAPSARHSDGLIVPFDEPLIDLAGLRPDRAYAAGQSGTIYAWNGSAWSISRPFTGAISASVWGAATGDVYALIRTAKVPARLLHLDGESWAELPVIEPPCTGEVTAGWASAPDDVFAIGAGELARFDGVSWTCYRGVEANGIFTSIWGSGRGDVWIIESGFNDAGRLYHWDGVGLRHWVEGDWIAQGGGATGGLIGTAADDVFFGTAAHFDGRVWSPIEFPPGQGPAVFALPSQLLTAGAIEGVEGVNQFVRTRFWNQRAHELDCTDGVDDDNDGSTDLDDLDCAAVSAPRPPASRRR